MKIVSMEALTNNETLNEVWKKEGYRREFKIHKTMDKEESRIIGRTKFVLPIKNMNEKFWVEHSRLEI